MLGLARQKNVHFIQTISPVGVVDHVRRKNKDGTRTEVPCPEPVKLYNMYMGGVDLADRKRKEYSCSKRSNKWWHRLFYFFLDVAVVNAHVLESISPHCQNRSQKDFRIELARELMSCHTSRKRKIRTSTDSAPPSARFCERHFPDILPKPLNCRYCSTSSSRKRTSYCCTHLFHSVHFRVLNCITLSNAILIYVYARFL